MQYITLPDEVYSTIATLAADRQMTPEAFIAELAAQAAWEEHAAQAYDAYIARQETEPHEALTEDEFLSWLHEVASEDANI